MKVFAVKLRLGGNAMESKGLRLNVTKIKVIFRACSVKKLPKKRGVPCSVCGNEIGLNSMVL